MLTINYTKKEHPSGTVSQMTYEVKQHRVGSYPSYFVFLAPSGKRYWSDGLDMGEISRIYFVPYVSDDMKLEGTPLGDKVRRILGIPSGKYLSYDIFSSQVGNQYWDYSSRQTSQNPNLWGFRWLDTIEYSSIVIDDESTDGELPLIITDELAEQITFGNVTGRTVACPEFISTNGVAKAPTFETLQSAANLVPFEDGTGYLSPFDQNDEGFINGFAAIPSGDGLTSNQRTARYLLEYIFEGVETYEDLKKKFYQTPRGTDVTYTVKANLNNGIASVNFGMTDKWTAQERYDEDTSINVYTEYEGVKLNKQTVGVVGIGTSYEIHAKCVNSSGNVVRDNVIAHIDSPTFPLNIDLDNINLKYITEMTQGAYDIYLYLKSYRTNFSLGLSGNVLVQYRDTSLNGSTETDNSIYFGVNYKFENTPIEPPRANTLNGGVNITETLSLSYSLDKKKPKTIIPDSPLPDLTGFAKVYKLASGDVVNFNSWLWGTNDLDPTANVLDLNKLKKINQNPFDNIMFLKVSPFDLESGSSYPITIGNLEYSEQVFPKVKTYSKIKIGDIKLTRFYSDYRDFKPFTTHRMFLPFVGFVDLDEKQMYGETCSLHCIVNSDTFIGIYDLRRNSDNMVLGQWECNAGLDYPLTSANMTQNVLSTVSNAFSTVEKTLSGNLAGGIDSLLDTIDSASQGLDIKKNSPSSNSAMAVSRWCYVETTTLEYNEPNNYAHTVGYPCNKTLRLGSCRGYTRVDNVDLSGIGATDSEISLLQNLLAQGVYM